MKEYFKISLKGFLIALLLIALLLIGILFGVRSSLSVQTSVSAKKYGVIIGDKDDNYKLYNNLTTVSKKGNVMVKANAICLRLDLIYKYDSKNKKLTITNIDNGKALIFIRNSKNYTYYSNREAKGIKKTSSCQFFYDKATKCNVIHIATLKHLINYKYYSSAKTKQYVEIGYKGGIIVFDKNRNISSLPPIKAKDTGVIVTSKASGTIAGVIKGMKETYDSSNKISKNIDNLNSALKSVYKKSWTIENTLQYLEKAKPSDWVMVVKDKTIGINISKWRSSYHSDIEKNMHLNAILETFRFFLGDEMGNSLWLLMDDLMINSGADETIYGFKHDGGKLIYKNGNQVTYEFEDNGNSLYLWLTPSITK